MFLDLGFRKYIEVLIGAKVYNNIKRSSRDVMMKQFEYDIKRTFTGSNDQTFSVNLQGVKDDPANNVVDGTITIKMWVNAPTKVPSLLRHALHRSALQTVFDHLYCQIERLVDDQIADVSEKGLPVKVMSPRVRKSRISY